MTSLVKATTKQKSLAWVRPRNAATVYRGGFTSPGKAWSFSRDIRVAREFDPYQVHSIRISKKTPALDVRRVLGGKSLAEVVVVPGKAAARAAKKTGRIRVKGHRRVTKRGKVARVKGFSRRRRR